MAFIKKHYRFIPLFFAILSLLLFVAYLVVVNPFAKEEEEVFTPLVPEEGEGNFGTQRLLYELISREQMKQITFHAPDGEYKLVSSKKNSPIFHLSIDGKLYDGEENPAPVFDEYGLSYAITSVGCLYVRERILEGAVTDEVMASFGLTEDTCQAWVEIELWETDENGNHKTLKVYIGNKTVNGQTYYVGLEGRNVVYVNNASSLQYALKQPQDYLVAPTLTTAPVVSSQNLQYYIGHFAILGGKDSTGKEYLNEIRDEEGYRVTDTDVAFVSFKVIRGIREVYSGVVQVDMNQTAEKQADLFARVLRPYLYNAEVGKTYGHIVTVNERVAVPNKFYHEKGDGGEVPFYEYKTGSDITFEVTVNYCYSPRLLVNVIGDGQDDPFHADASYVFTAPQTMTSYVVSSSNFQNVLDAFAPLTGTKIVKIGIDEEDFTNEYGLGHMTVLFGMPTMFYQGEDGNPQALSYDENKLYISKKQLDEKTGNYYYYVGSAVYSLIARVEAETLPFLEDWTLDTWVSKYVQGVHYYNVKGAEYEVNFDDFKGHFRFDVTRESDLGVDSDGNKQTNPVLYVTELLSKQRVDADNFNMMNALFVFMKLKGTIDEDIDLDAIMTEENRMLTYTLYLVNGEKHVYEFYPYSSGRVLLVIDGSAQFYLYTADLKTIVYNLDRLMKGEQIDTSVRY